MILVVGSTGLVGGMITRTLLERRRALRLLVRPGSDYGRFVEAGAEATLGDLKDPASLVSACRGVDTVITTASAGQRGGDDNPQTVDLEGNRHLIEVARGAGVKQFVFLSTIAASADHPVPVPRAKAAAEATLRESGLPFTIVAANCIADVMFPVVIGYPISLGRPVTLVGEGRRRHTFIAARDVASFAVAAIGHPSAPGLTELVSGLLAALEAFDTQFDMTSTASAFGVTPTTLEEFVANELRDKAGTSVPSVPSA